MDIKVIRSDVEFEGKLLRLRIDQLEQPGGRLQQVELVEHPGAVAIVPIDANGVWLVRQYRHAAGQELLEIPAGTLDPGETPEACAARECREEIGMAPGRVVALGAGFLAPGYSTEQLHFFLAEDLVPGPLPPDSDEQIEIQQFSLEQAWELVTAGRIADIKTIAGLALARAHLRNGR